MSQLPDVSQEEKAKLLHAAVTVANTKGRKEIVQYLLVAFVENAKLTQEVNRLRTLCGEEPIKTF